MITSIVLWIAATFLSGILFFLYPLTVLVPDSFENYLSTFLGYLNYFRGWFPVSTLITAVGAYTAFVISLYTVRLVLFVYALSPFFGKKVALPKSKSTPKK